MNTIATELKADDAFKAKFREEIEHAVETYQAVTGDTIAPEDMTYLMAQPENRENLRAFLYFYNGDYDAVNAIVDMVYGDDHVDCDYDAAPKREKVSLERFVEKYTHEIALTVMLLIDPAWENLNYAA
jgi:hypothetical protein